MLMKEDLKAELEELEQDELNERLSGAERVPVHLPAGARAEGMCSVHQPLFRPSTYLTLSQKHGKLLHWKTTRRRNSKNYKQPWPCSSRLRLAFLLSIYFNQSACVLIPSLITQHVLDTNDRDLCKGGR
jgi:hypothetical protein